MNNNKINSLNINNRRDYTEESKNEEEGDKMLPMNEIKIEMEPEVNKVKFNNDNERMHLFIPKFEVNLINFYSNL
jgi:hypothetical protein